jgi:FtsH-binding integral membrane protein
MTAGLGFTGALATSYLAVAAGISPMICTFGGLIAMLGGFLGAGRMTPYPANETYNGIPILKTANTPARLALFGLGLAGLGLSAAPIFAHAMYTAPHILPSAIGISAAIFGGASLVAYSMPKDRMLSAGRILGGSLLGLIGLQLVGLLSFLITGPNAFSSLLFRADNYLGILLFSGFVAYDTHVAIKSYEMGYADHLGISIQFIMNIWNILMRVISIMTDNRG